MRYLPAALLASLALHAAPADAATLQMTITGTYDGIYDVATGKTETFGAPKGFTAFAELPLGSYTGTPTVPEAYTNFDASQLKITSPFMQWVGADPVGNGLADLPGEAFAQAEVSIFGHGFYQSRLTLSQHVDHFDDVNGWTYDASLVFCCGTPASLIDSGQLVMTPDMLVDFLTLHQGYAVTFNTGWARYKVDYVDGVGTSTYIAGTGPTGVKAVLSSFKLVSDVPEPRTWAMMVFGFAATGYALRRRKRRAVPVAGIEPATFGLQNRCSTS